MRQEVRRPSTPDVSPLEEIYRQIFHQQNLTLSTRFDQSAFQFPTLQNGAWVPLNSRRYVTYVTYGACEDPILAR